MIFTAHDYKRLHSIVFAGNYPGFKDDVIELPNGDGKADVGKRYAHVALKYLEQATREGYVDRTDLAFMTACLFLAQDHAEEVARKLNVPKAFFPVIDDATLRVLEYPAGVGGEAHTDFDLFTLNAYRSCANRGLGALGDVHIGEIGELIGLGPATPHYIDPLPGTSQHSIVFFAMPSHAAVLHEGYDIDRGLTYEHVPAVTVGSWLKERYARSRAYK